MMFPNFLCIGAPKSGTTSLYDVLKQHKDVFLPTFKEPHFFDSNKSWNKGVEWYQSSYYAKASHQCVGDFTPTYLSNNLAPGRIRKVLGNQVKFVVILRNPIDRAYSHYLHTKRDQHENLSFIEALEEEEQRLNKYRKENDHIGMIRFAYQEQGMYAKQLDRYFKLFDRGQFYITTFDDFVSKQEHVIKEVCAFLGLQHQEGMQYVLQSNKSSEARSVALKNLIKKPSMIKKLAKWLVPSFAIRQKLRNYVQALNNKSIEKKPLSEIDRKNCYQRYFKQEIQSLEDLLSINLTHWKHD